MSSNKEKDKHSGNENTDGQGIKYDQEKIRLDLVPINPLIGTAKVLTFGCAKYGDRNWEKGMLYHRCYGAALRHMTSWWNGEDLDPETGLSHLYHAMCCLMFLGEYVSRPEQFNSFDDRPHKADK